MNFSTIINNILILKSICLVSNAIDRQLLNIYISGPNLQEVHDVTVKAEKLIPPSNVQTRGVVGNTGRILPLKDVKGR